MTRPLDNTMTIWRSTTAVVAPQGSLWNDGAMGENERGPRGSHPVVYAVVGALMLVLLAAAMPKVFPFLRGDHDAPIVLPDTPAFADFLIVAISILLVVLAVMLRLSVASVSDPRFVRKRRPLWQQILVFLLIFWSVALFASRFADRRDDEPVRSPVNTEGSPAPVDPGASGEQRSKTLGLALTIGLGAAALGLGLAIYLLGRGGVRHGGRGPDTSQLLAEELSIGIDELRSSTDPREAVIACYRRMERILVAGGVPLHDSDTPLEVLGRALHAMDVPEDSARRLTDLFERARFSLHAMDETMRADAVAALEDVRRSLATEEVAWSGA